MTAIVTIDGLSASVGQVIGASSWHDVTQERLQAFADATEDWNPIHVDPTVAAETEFGTTIAHGLFTLSLDPKFHYELFEVTDASKILNYGYDKVRWLAPVPVGSRVRMRMELKGSEPIEGGVKFRALETYEVEGQEQPVCVTEHLFACYR